MSKKFSGVRLDAAMISAVDLLALDEKRSRSDMIRVLLDEALNKRTCDDGIQSTRSKP